ncbi:Fic family protein [Jonesiaceae bacterium BS-20]|uniref:Fic family protein n=1 Tax=Jonesiaceae bacterium BS-20 TaxID=3120821 RepID=A0AAU7DTV6_9MICO
MDSHSLQVPAVTYEELQWTPKHNLDVSNRARIRQTGPYRSAITAPIADWKFQVSSELMTELEDALVALREFDQHANHSLPQGSLNLGPLASILLRTESVSSSQIEQLTTSAKQLALAEIDQGKSNATTVLANVHAMQAAIDLAESLSISSILQMHGHLLIDSPSLAAHAGKLRGEPVWIGGRDSAGPRNAEFVPPRSDLVPQAIADLEGFMSRVDLPVLLQVAVAHAQFETIHPFVDGNGRTGRALVHAMLHNFGMSRSFVLPISSGILTDLKSYFSALTQYREGDAAPIVRLFAQATRYAAHHGMRLIDSLQEQVNLANTKLVGLRPQAAAWKLVPLLVGQPVVNAKFVKEHLQVNDAAAHRALNALTQRGFLVETSGNSRNRIWQHNGILDVLNEYAEQIRRDSR